MTDYVPTAHDWPEHFSHENGQYQCECVVCRKLFTAHKRSVVCRVCWYAPKDPIPMILHCPSCHVQHIDEPKARHIVGKGNGWDIPDVWVEAWTNPPHRSHLCHACGHIWRPADVATTGVSTINTRGSSDSYQLEGPT